MAPSLVPSMVPRLARPLNAMAVIALWLALTVLAVWLPAHAQDPAAPTRYDEMNALITRYNARFAIPESRREPLRRQFIALQNQTLARWTSLGALHPLLEVRNDLRASLIYTISALQDEQGRLMGLVYAQSEYEDSVDESSLRLFHRAHLESGVSFAGLKQLDALRLQIPSGGVEANARAFSLRLAYALDLKKQSFASVDLWLEASGPLSSAATGLAAPSAWRLRDPATQRLLTHVQIEFWYSLLSFNGGVKRLHLNSRP